MYRDKKRMFFPCKLRVEGFDYQQHFPLRYLFMIVCYIYNYAHSFFGKDFQFKPLHW